MSKPIIAASLALACLTATGCISTVKAYHGYAPDEINPADVEPGLDTRSSVLAQLGSPSRSLRASGRTFGRSPPTQTC